MRHSAGKNRFFIAAVLAGLLAGCGSAEDRAKAYYESGSQYLEEKDYAKAAVEFRNALKLNDDNADAWFGMAQVEEQAQNWPRVFGDLSKVLEINPKHVPALVALSTLQSLSGDFAGAMANANTAAELEPTNADVAALKASVLFKLGDKDGAIKEATKAVGLKADHPEATIILASGMMERGDNAGALRSAEAALADNPTSLGLHLLRVAVLEKTGDFAGQEAALRQMIVAFPEQSLFKTSLIQFLVGRGRADDAEKELRAATAAQPSNSDAGLELVAFLRKTKGEEVARDQLVELANSALQPLDYQIALADFDYAAGRSEDAAAQLRLLATKLGISDGGIRTRLKLVDLLLASKQYTEAESIVEEVLENDSQNAEALKQRGAIAIEMGKPDTAINDLRAALNLDSKNVAIHMLLASAYENSGEIELADKSLADAVRNAGNDPQAGLAYERFLLRRGNDERAENVLRDLADRFSANRDVLTELGKLRARNKDWVGVEEVANQLNQLGGGSEIADLLRGTALMAQNKYDDAIKLFSKAGTESASDSRTMQALVGAYVSVGKMAEAENFLYSVLEAHPGNVSALVLLGALQNERNEPDKARASFTAAITAAPQTATGYQALADFLVAQGKAEESAAVLAEGIKNADQKANLRFALASQYESAGRFDEAIQQYEIVVADEPGSLVAVNNLASLLCDHRSDTESLARAASLAAALRNSPIPYFRETLGWALVKNGNLKEGIALLERSIGELGDVASAQLHLGTAYALSGERELAIKHLQLALDLEKLPATRERITQAIASAKSAL